MMSMSRVRDDTPQPTMSVTDGAATFSMFCGSGGRNRVRGRQTCGDAGEPARPAASGAPTSSSPQPHSRSAPSSSQPRVVPGAVSSPAKDRVSVCAPHWYNCVATVPPHFREGPPTPVTGELTEAAGPHPPRAAVPDPMALQRRPMAGTRLGGEGGALNTRHRPRPSTLAHPGGSANSSCSQRPPLPPRETSHGGCPESTPRL